MASVRGPTARLTRVLIDDSLRKGYVYMLECVSDVQLNLSRVSDKHPRSGVASGSVPAEVRSGPAALGLRSLPKVSVTRQELRIVFFSCTAFSLLFFSFLSFLRHISRVFHIWGDCRVFAITWDAHVAVSFERLNSADFWTDSGRRVVFLSSMLFYLSYDHNHSRASAGMLTFHKGRQR